MTSKRRKTGNLSAYPPPERGEKEKTEVGILVGPRVWLEFRTAGLALCAIRAAWVRGAGLGGVLRFFPEKRKALSEKKKKENGRFKTKKTPRAGLQGRASGVD